MIHIKFSPVRRDEALELSCAGDALTLNGETVDLAPLPDGGTLPSEAIASPWFAGPVSRIAGDLHLTLILPHGSNAPHETRFPEPITVSVDGPVTLPIYDTPEAEA